MQQAMKESPPTKFIVPEGMSLIPVNRKTGMRAMEGELDTIVEAFKPGTGPADSFNVIGMEGTVDPDEIMRTSPQANQAVTSGAGGLF